MSSRKPARAAEAGGDRQIVPRRRTRSTPCCRRSASRSAGAAAATGAAITPHPRSSRTGRRYENTSSLHARVMMSKASSKRARDWASGTLWTWYSRGMPRAKPRNQPPVRHAVEHRQLFGQSQRLVQWQQIAVDQQFEVFGALRRRGGQQIGRVHQPIGRAVMLVEPDPVIAEPVELLPGVEMLGIGARRDLRLEMLASPADRAARCRSSDDRAARHKPKDRRQRLSWRSPPGCDPTGRIKPVQPESGLLYRRIAFL